MANPLFVIYNVIVLTLEIATLEMDISIHINVCT